MAFFSVISGVVLALLLRYFFRRIRQSQRAKALGCGPIRYYPHWDPLFGSDVFLGNFISAVRGTRISKILPHRYLPYGKTYALKTPRSIWIHTVEPENLAALFGKGIEINLKEDSDTACNDVVWGNAPLRFVMEPFCGKGFLTTDGEQWQHYRNMLKPSFTRDVMADLTWFKQAADEFVTSLPGNEHPVDLSPKLDQFVSCFVFV
jgi:hypothetical protein